MNKKITIGLILGVLIFSIGMTQPLAAQVLQQDSLALVALYDSTDGANWNNAANWLIGDVGTWYGIYVSSNRVTSIALERNNLVGPIPPEFGNLTDLEFCSCYANQLSGSIPPEIGNLVNLRSLRLDDNQLTGAIPAEIGNLVNLEDISLYYNQLSDTIPPEIANLTKLIYLNFHSNQLTGSIPSQIGNLTQLGTLSFYNNQLTGPIPPEISNLTNLQYCDLSENQLSENIPPEIGNLVQLLSLNLGSNQLSGAIPAEIGMLINLKSLELGVNQLIGTISSEIGNLIHLTSLSLNFNQLSGTIPPEIGNLSSLTYLYLSANQLTDPIPEEIFNLTNLKRLILSGNQFSGSIPVEIERLINLTHLLIQGNQFTGPIPPEIGNLTQLEWLYLNNNQLVGAVPEKIGNLPSLQWLYLYDNQLTDLPDLSADTSLLYLRIENNDFTFEDIEPNIFVSSFCYAPQDSVGEKQDISIEQGASLTLSVTVGGTANQYQWQKNGFDISGANGNSYIIYPVTSDDQGVYCCKITNTIAPNLTLYSRKVHVKVGGGVAIADDASYLPHVFALQQNYPNPFNPTTLISYDLPNSTNVTLKIYNVQGQEIRTLVDEFQSAGVKSVVWDGLDASGNKVTSGVYFYQISAGDFSSHKKMLLIQ